MKNRIGMNEKARRPAGIGGVRANFISGPQGRSRVVAMVGMRVSRDDAPPPGATLRGMMALSRQAQRVVGIIRSAPGLNIDEVAAHLGLRRTAANHHLRVLLRSGLVVRVRQGRHALHFPVETPPAQRRAICLLRVPGMHALARDLFENPVDTCAARALRIGVTDRHVRRGLSAFVRQDLVRIEGGGARHASLVHLHPDLRLLLVRWTPPAPPPRGDAGWPTDLP